MFHPPHLKLDESARDFLKRIDAVEEITLEHYIWYKKHPDDQFNSIEDLRDEMRIAEQGSPVRLDSKSGTMREIAKYHDNERKKALVERGQVWPIGFNIGRFYNLLLSRWRIICQLFRVPIVLTTILTSFLIFSLRDEVKLLVSRFFLEHLQIGATLSKKAQTLVNDCPFFTNLNLNPFVQSLQDGTIFNVDALPTYLIDYITLPLLIILVIRQLYCLFFDDKIFARAWLGFSSKTKEGLYCHPKDSSSQAILQKMPILKEPEQHPTGWFNGDLQTIIPGVYLDGIDLKIPYIRRYVKNVIDEECCGADIAFPRDPLTNNLYFNPSKPIFLFHHGLNGSSQASYVQAHVDKYTKAGHTCIAMNVRGFGGTMILRKMFIGSRVTDLHYLTTLAHIGAGNNTLDGLEMFTRRSPHTLRDDEPQLVNFSSVFKNGNSPMNMVDNFHLMKTPVCGVGFSMGGIIISNYCVLYGKYCGLQSAFAVCAIGDRNSHNNTQSERDWELALADTLKGFVSRSEPLLYSPQCDSMLGDGVTRYIDLIKLAGSKSIADFDGIFTCVTHGVGTMKEYYHDLSFAQCQKLENLKTKLFIIHPSNDPVVDVDNMYPVTQILIEEDQQDEEFVLKRVVYYKNHDNIKNLITYIPFNGGHVSSFRSWNDQWGYLSDLIYQFHMTVDEDVKIAEEKGGNYYSWQKFDENDIKKPYGTFYCPPYQNYSTHMIDILLKSGSTLEGANGNNDDDHHHLNKTKKQQKVHEETIPQRRRPFSAIVKPRERQHSNRILPRKNVVESSDDAEDSQDEINDISPKNSTSKKRKSYAKPLSRIPVRSKSPRRKSTTKKNPLKVDRASDSDEHENPTRRTSKARKPTQ